MLIGRTDANGMIDGGRWLGRRRFCKTLALGLGVALSAVLAAPNQAEAGGLPPPRPAPGSKLGWPAIGRITTYFGEVGPLSPRGHAGLDIAAPSGTPIVAAASGTVAATGWNGPYGLRILIDHDNGLQTHYAHLSAVDVEPGQRIAKGKLIGRMGSTGFSTGPHLHFEVREEGALRNPVSYLR